MYYEKLTAFFKEYVVIPSDMFDKNGLVTNEHYIRYIICFMLKDNLFEKEELRKTALKDYQIIIPHCYFVGEGE